jgi:hypothetical protein
MDSNSPARILDLTDMEEVGGYLGGTNPGAQFQSSSGQKYYAKQPSLAPLQVWTEVFASRVYELAGIPAAKTYAGLNANWTGGLWLVSEWVDHSTDVLDRLEDPSSDWVQEALRGFAVDAWLGNYDVVGDIYTNLVTVEGKPFRLDNGAALYYTATGKEKHWWSDEPTDLVDMRYGADYSWAYETAVELFQHLTDDIVAESVMSTLFPLDEGCIENLVGDFGRLLRPDTLATVLARKRYIENKILL